MNENWPRWFFASVSKHFTTLAPSITFIEGTHRQTPPDKTHAEFRMDGPRVRPVPGGDIYNWIAVNILFNTAMDSQEFHEKHRLVGEIVSAFTESIPIFRYGDGPDDDGEQIGCFALLDRGLDTIRVNHFGQIDPAIRLEQGTIEGHYETYLTP